MKRAIALSLLMLASCWGDPEPLGPPCTRNAGACRSRDDVTRSVTKDAQGQLVITAAEAIPSLGTQPGLPPAADHARACVKLNSCTQLPLEKCLQPDASEENNIPFGTTNERVLFLIHEALKPGADCAALKKLETARATPINCESHGCEWISQTDPVPTVTCNGDVATLTAKSATFTRDCAHSFAKCDPKSPTGCSDRPLIKCPSDAIDKCDGDVQIGCRQIGFVSARNCALYGGKCSSMGTFGNATCVYDKACTPSPTCKGTAVEVCLGGTRISVDCAANGFTTCASGKCT
jgi:hypothetical protein